MSRLAILQINYHHYFDRKFQSITNATTNENDVRFKELRAEEAQRLTKKGKQQRSLSADSWKFGWEN